MKKKYAKGTDSVDAKLTPREAVLNRNAAELLGRDAIARLNAHGNMLAKRGVDLASLPSDPTPGPSTENMLGYQGGTEDVNQYRRTYGPTLSPPVAGEIPGYGVRKFDDRGIPYYAQPGVGVKPQPSTSFGTPYERYQMGTSMVESDDRADLLRDADNAFYGGGQAPMPTPTPTSTPRMRYQYGAEDILRRRNAVSRFSGLRTPPARMTSNYSGNFGSQQGSIIQGSGAGSGGYGYTQGTGSLPPDQNPAYQAAIAKGRPSRSAYTTIQLPSGGTASVPIASKQRYLDLIQPRGIAQDRAEVAASLAASDPRVYAAGYGPVTPPPITAQQRVQRGQAGAGELASVAAHNILGVPQNQGLGSAYLGFGMRNLTGVVNAASRIGQGIANVFTGGNTQAAPIPSAGPQPSPTPFQTPAPTPVPTPTPSPTAPPQITPDQNPYGFQYGTASVPRRYSDYY